MSNTEDTQRAASMPLIGDEFPEMEVQTSQGTLKLPDDFEGQWFVLFSHPGDFTPVCTTEFVSFEQHREEFEELNAQLVGLSVDRVHSHIKWTDWIDENLDVDIGFPIIADETGRVGEKLGMIHPGESTSTVRAVFIVNPEGIIRLILYYPLDVGRNIDEIVRALKGLQTSDEQGYATPADWPNNETFGDRVLLPPPSTEEDAKARLAEAEGDESLQSYDWWFTMKQR